MFAGVLKGERSGGPDVAKTLSDSLSRYEHLSTQCLEDSERFKLFAQVRNDARDHLASFQISPTISLWLYRLDRPLDSSEEFANRIRRIDWSKPPSLPGLWIALWRDDASLRLRVISDYLGVCWLYYAPIEDGFAFSCDFGALARTISPELRLDKDTALLELVYGYSPDDATLYDPIRIVPPASVLELGWGSSRVVSRRSPKFGDRLAGVADEAKFAELDRIFDRIAEDYLLDTGTVLSLSAGYDSRYALGILTNRGQSPPLVTFGDPDSLEVEGARDVAARVGKETDLFNFDEANWDSWVRCLQQLGNSAMAQWSGWAEEWLRFVRQRGSAVAIGYLGDALSGKHLVPSESSWLESWIAWSKGPWAESTLLTRSARARLTDLARERFESVGRGVDFAFPHQQALLLDWRGRQRRWVASQPNLIARFLSPVTYLYDEELLEFWANIAEPDLFGQKLYLAYARSRFPKLFGDEETNPKLWSRIVTKFRRMLTPGSRRIRPPVIDRGRIVLRRKNEILALFEASRDDFGEIIDFAALNRVLADLDEKRPMDPRLSLLLIQVTNVLILGACRRVR